MPGVIEEVDDGVGSPDEAAELAPGVVPEGRDVAGHCVQHRLLLVLVALLFGVELRGVGRQEHVGDVVRLQPGSRDGAPVRVRPVPDQRQRRVHRPCEVREHVASAGAVDGADVVPREEPRLAVRRGRDQEDYARDFAPFTDAAEDGRLALRAHVVPTRPRKV